MAQAASASPSPSPAAPAPTWIGGHAVTSPARCCAAHRGRFVVYAATDACLAVVDVLAEPPDTAAPEVRWRRATRLCPLSSPAESIAFVAGHPERAVVCVGTAQHGLYVTSLTSPSLTEATKLPRSVTGDCTYGAAFLFTEEANYLAFSSLLHSRPSDPTPHRLSLWNLSTRSLLWRGAMGPLRSMCSFAHDLSFAACSAGRVGLFSVQSSAAEGQAEAPSVKHGERSRLMVLSRHCSAVDELSEVTYACCTASPVEGEETYLALTTSGFLVAFSAATGSVVRWMDCKVPAATALCSVGRASLLLTGGVARLFHAETWEFQGKVKWHDALAADDAAAAADEAPRAFTCGAGAGDGAVALFHSGGALSLYTTEAKPGTQRLGLHRVSLFTPPPLTAESPAEVWALSASLWCWWTPQALLFVTPPGCALHGAVPVATSCATLHPASGAVIVFDRARRALVAYGRTSDGPAELASTAAMDAGHAVVSLASSAAGDVVYALVTAAPSTASASSSGAASSAASRLLRFQCGWAAKEGGGGRALRMEQLRGSAGGGGAGPAVPAGTHSVVVYSSAGASAADSDIIVAVQRSAITVLPGAGADADKAGSSPGPTYTHADPIARVVQCRDGLVVAGAVTCAHVQLRGGATRWVMKPLPDPDAAAPAPAGRRRENGATGPAPLIACAVARHRGDVVVVCRPSRLCAWQLAGDAATLIAERPAGSSVHAVWGEEDKEAAGLIVWTLGPGGVAQYRLGPLARAAALPVSAEKLLPRPAEPAPTATGAPEPAKRTRTPGGMRKAPVPAAAAARVASSPPPPSSAPAKAASPPSAATAPAARHARTPRALASTAGDVTRAAAAAEARRQRRTASAGAPSSRELSDRFTELTGFYAQQRRDKSVGDHIRTPRPGGAGRRSFPSTETDPPTTAAVAQPPHTPRVAVAAPTRGLADSVAEAVDVSALTIDSQVLRAAVSAAAPALGTSEAAAVVSARKRDGAAAAATAVGGGPKACVDSPPQRSEARRDARRPLLDADDAVLHSSASNGASKASLFSGVSRAEDGPRASNGGASAATTAEQFSVHARHLRESLLNLKELLEQSELADTVGTAAASEASCSDVPEADLDELSALLSTVAAQLQLRQVRRSAEGGVQAAAPPRVAGTAAAAPDTYAAVATELARIQAQNTRLEEQNRIILTQLRAGQH